MIAAEVAKHLDAEKAVIGAVLLRPDAYDRADLTCDEFHHPAHRLVWRAIEELRAASHPIDAVSVAESLGDRAHAVGGVAGLCALIAAVPTADNAEHYARLIRSAALTRRLRIAVSEAIGSGLEGEDLRARLWESLSAVSSRDPDTAMAMAELSRECYVEAARMADSRRTGSPLRTGIATGLCDLDHALSGGLDLGAVTVLGGRPSDGKSAMARTFADNAMAAGWPVMVFSLEDNRAAYGRRVLSDRAGVDLHAMRTADLDTMRLGNLMSAANDLRTCRHWVVDDARGISATQLAMRVRRRRQELDPGRRGMLVVLDYLQLVRGEGRDRRAVIESALGTFADLCGNDGLAGLVVSQLNRDASRDGRRPELHDLRETGEIEQIASTVILLHHERVGEEIQRSVAIVAKQKHGPRGAEVPLTFHGPTATWRPLREPWQTHAA